MNEAHRSDFLKPGNLSKDMRKSARVYGSFPIRMRGFDGSGCMFKANSLVDNISAGGLYVQVGRPPGEGSRLFAVVQLVSGATIAARGFVARVESRAHGLSGVAVRFTRTRLLPPLGSATSWASEGSWQ
jgi:hypothetical protein